MPVPPYTTDTSSEAEQVQLALIRAMSPSERVRRAMQLTNQMRRMARAAIRRQHPPFSEEQIGIKLIELHYGEQLAREVQQHLASRKQ